jgi:ferredoxin--NADP+ reductase
MIRTELNLKEPRKFVVVQGARYSWDLGYRDELATLNRITDLFYYLPAITQPSSDLSWSGFTGRIQPLVESGVIEEKTGLELTPENFDVFLCGNPLMVEGVSEILVSKGFSTGEKKETGNVHREKYW